MRVIVLASLAVIGIVLMNSPSSANERPLKIGLITDMSGIYSDFFGEGSVLAAKMAIEDVGGVVAGRKIELETADHLNKVDVGVSIARKMIDVDGVEAIVDVPTSSIGLAVSELVRQKNKVFLASGPFTSVLTSEQCSPNTVQWTVDNWALAHAVTSALVASGAKTWFFVTADYAFGQDMERVATETIQKGGGKVVGGVRHPLDTPDMASFILQAQTSGAETIGLATAGNDTSRAITAANEFGLTKKGKTIVGFTLGLSNVRQLGLDLTAGMKTSAPFYWDLNDTTRAWSRKFQGRHSRHNMPSEMQAAVYSALINYFKALNTGVDASDGKAVVDAMKAAPTDDPIFGRGEVRPDGRKIHPMYVLQVKKPSEPHEPWDYFTVSATIPAEEAFRPMAEGRCALVKQ